MATERELDHMARNATVVQHPTIPGAAEVWLYGKAIGTILPVADDQLDAQPDKPGASSRICGNELEAIAWLISQL